MANYNQSDITIMQMVLNRLPYMQNTTSNQTLIGSFIYETCYEMDRCFKVAISPKDDEHRVGDEQYYNQVQKSIVADLTAVSLLIVTALQNMGGGVDGNGNPIAPKETFIKRAEAGSATVEYDQFDINKSTLLALKPELLIAKYKKSAINNAAGMSCYFDITDESSIHWLSIKPEVKPFYIVGK